MSSKYSVLSALPFKEQQQITAHLCIFFPMLNANQMREELEVVLRTEATSHLQKI